MANCDSCGYEIRERLDPRDTCCKACSTAFIAAEEAREQSYIEARERRAAERIAEYEAWRERRYAECIAEAERYEILRDERRAAREQERNREWYEFLHYAAERGIKI